MNSFNNDGSVWYSKLESEVLLTDLYNQLGNFPDNEKAKVVTSWLSNSFADLTNPSSDQSVSETDAGINLFIVHIKLVNSLVNNSSSEIAHDLSDQFSNDFLHTFVKSSLLNTCQNGKALAEATTYFQLVCENLTQPLLIRKVVKFAINSQLLPALVLRLKSKDTEVLGATLGLFRALFEFYCEDIWHELVLQHLLPMKHLLVSERQRAIPEINFQDSTFKFIDILPSSIYGSLPPETLADNFILYVQQEMQRLRGTDVRISSTTLPPSHQSGIPSINNLDTEIANISTTDKMNSNFRNSLFPLWSFKYDGTDVIHASRKYNKLSEPEEYFENDLFQFFNNEQIQKNTAQHEDQDDIEEINPIPTLTQLPEGPEPVRFYAESVENGIIHVVGPSNTHPHASSWKAVSEDQGYFGPFLESLFQILDKWTWLDSDVIIRISDLFSVLASSRIPLITSILLDFSVVLQPCFPNFHGILHSIKAKLDGSLKKYPESFIQQEWRRATSRASNSTGTKSNTGEQDLNFADTLRLKFLKSSPFAFVSKSTNSKLAKLFGPQPKEKRILNASTTFKNEEEEVIARKSILRSIMFAHWMLELAAIAQQSCWHHSRQNQRQEESDQF